MRKKYRKHKRQESITLYVSAGGNDGNNGLSPDSSLATVAKAEELLGAAGPIDGRVKCSKLWGIIFRDAIMMPYNTFSEESQGGEMITDSIIVSGAISGRWYCLPHMRTLAVSGAMLGRWYCLSYTRTF